MKKSKKLKPNLPSGFKDTDTEELVLRDSLIEIIKRNFQLYGFEQIDTSSSVSYTHLTLPTKA